ncbi:hypothetical protein MMC13_004993 [Lambiella insularis]|nr:hypothetical protein [Lambiella insularis]
MAAIQLGFTLRTSTNVKTVHLLGSWDNYSGQLPLSKDSTKAGGWKGTFRFQGATIQPGQRYWYYYIMDGYHVSHDPAQAFTKEPTTGRSLNILDVPASRSTVNAPPLSMSKRGAARQAAEIPKGRSLSPSKIIHPKPSKPYASRRVREADYSMSPGMDDLSSQLEQASLYGYGRSSPPSSVGSSLSSRSSSGGGSSPSSLSSLSDRSAGSCRCNRYGITRKGDRIKIDCGGSKCGYNDDSSSGCSSESSSEDEAPSRHQVREVRPRVQEVRPRQQASRKEDEGKGRSAENGEGIEVIQIVAVEEVETHRIVKSTTIVLVHLPQDPKRVAS